MIFRLPSCGELTCPEVIEWVEPFLSFYIISFRRRKKVLDSFSEYGSDFEIPQFSPTYPSVVLRFPVQNYSVRFHFNKNWMGNPCFFKFCVVGVENLAEFNGNDIVFNHTNFFQKLFFDFFFQTLVVVEKTAKSVPPAGIKSHS